jgi:hypothetical protein
MSTTQQVQDLYRTICDRAGLDAGMWNVSIDNLPRRETIEELEKVIGYMVTQKIDSEERALSLRQISDGTEVGSVCFYEVLKGRSFSPTRFGVLKITKDKRNYVDPQRLEELHYLSFLEDLRSHCR